MSDAHANPPALDLALKDAEKHKCGKFVFLGDTTGYGYDVKGTLKLVRENFDAVIMGNHDAVCCGLHDGQYVRINPHYDLDRAQGRKISRIDRAWLRSLDYTFEDEHVACTHGDFVDPAGWGYVIDSSDAWGSFMKCPRNLMFCGHTHHACIWELEGKKLANRFEEEFQRPALEPESISFKLKKGARYIVNAGSVGYPRHDLCCSYAIYDSETRRLTIRRLPFDFKGYVNAMIDAGVDLPQWLGEILLAAAGMKGKRKDA